jgi:hypothetical protein
VYIALHRAELPHEQLGRWLVAYWCLYHCGAACHLSELEGLDFYGGLMRAAENVTPSPAGGRWPRGHERRHWRAKNAVATVDDLINKYGSQPEGMVERCAQGAPKFSSVNIHVQSHVGFGPWMSFKVADMLDRVCGIPVDFTQPDVFMFKDPEEAALKVWRAKQGLPDDARPKDRRAAVSAVVDHLTATFASFSAPPLMDRPVGLQEVETVLCKFKSHLNGHYPLDNDIREIAEGLAPWVGVSQTARVFLSSMPSLSTSE